MLLLAEQTPASFVAFDLLALGDEDLMRTPFRERRLRLVGSLADAEAPVHVTPATADVAEAEEWFTRFEGAGLDGVVAKPLDGTYRPDKRTMFKIKHERTADCVVAGFRWHTSGDVVGSLLLGLYADDGRLQHVGVSARRSRWPAGARCSTSSRRTATSTSPSHPWGQWADAAAHADRRLPGNVSRWNATKDLSFVPLRPELVVEVAYDHMEGTRFRHTAQFRRWRPDRTPESCTYAQLDVPVTFDLADILGLR